MDSSIFTAFAAIGIIVAVFALIYFITDFLLRKLASKRVKTFQQFLNELVKKDALSVIITPKGDTVSFEAQTGKSQIFFSEKMRKDVLDYVEEISIFCSNGIRLNIASS